MGRTMKAARLHGALDLRLEQVPEPPAPGPGEVLLAVRAVGLCGSDLHYWTDGRIGDTPLTDPLIPGHEPAGEVLAVGPGVTGLAPGDRVAIDPALHCGHCEWCLDGNPNLCPHVRFFGTPPIDGALRERLVHPAEALYRLPDGLDFIDGALAEPLGVAVHAVDLAHLRPGQTAAVLGCGPIGLATLLVARLGGAGPIWATDLLAERRATAARLGADDVFEAADGAAVEAILAATGGRGVDVVFECATSVQTQLEATRVAAIGGCVVLVGIPPEDRFELQHSVARRKGLTVKFARRMRAVYPRALALAARVALDLRALATHRFPLEASAAAFELAAAQADGVIKAVVEW